MLPDRAGTAIGLPRLAIASGGMRDLGMAAPQKMLAELEAHTHQSVSDLWFYRVQIASGIIVVWAAVGYTASWLLLQGDELGATDVPRIARIVVTGACGLCVLTLYPMRNLAQRARVTAAHALLLAIAVVLHFLTLLQEAGGSINLRSGALRQVLTTGQTVAAFGVPFVFFYLSIYSLFAHALALHSHRLAERAELAKELLVEAQRKPQDAALLRHLDDLVQRQHISQDEYIARRNALLNALQPKPLTIAERLRLVDELRKEGAITEEEYTQKRNDLLNSV